MTYASSEEEIVQTLREMQAVAEVVEFYVGRKKEDLDRSTLLALSGITYRLTYRTLLLTEIEQGERRKRAAAAVANKRPRRKVRK